VYFRAAGQGPVLVLLHQSPQNSRAMLPWIERLASQFCVIAPDTPGFGFSDPLAHSNPEIPDFAAALAQFLGAIGVEKCVMFGVHTGAVTAMRLALDFPGKVAGLVLDGYARFDKTEREALLNGYLPPFEPTWDGLHLPWAWARMREQHFFFPWFDPSLGARMNYGVPGVSHVHGNVMDLLDAGDHYRAGYRAPFMYDDATAAARLTVPARILNRVEDVLISHLDRLPALPAHVKAERVEGGVAALIAKADAAFADMAGGATRMDSGQIIRAGGERRVKGSAMPHVAWRHRSGGGAKTRVIIGDLARPASFPVDCDAWRETVVVELPMHGASIGWEASMLSADSIVRRVADSLNDLHTPFHIFGQGAGAGLAALLARALGDRAASLTLDDPLLLNEAERNQYLDLLPDPTLQVGGGHLLAAWQWARHRYLFWPWLPQTGAAARKVASPAPRRVHGDVVEALRCGVLLKPLAQALLSIDAAAVLAALTIPIRVQAQAGEHARLAARAGLPHAGARDGLEHWKR
jgi:pimeloyl-ACP methyl ester carboxylesterase